MLQEIIHLLNSQSLGLTHSTNLVSLLLLTHSIKLWLTEFYIHQLRENVTEPTDGALGIGHGAWGIGHWALGIGHPYSASSATLRERLRRTQYSFAQGKWALGLWRNRGVEG